MKKYIAEFVGTALSLVWLFILAPLVGAGIAALVHKYVLTAEE